MNPSPMMNRVLSTKINPLNRFDRNTIDIFHVLGGASSDSLVQTVPGHWNYCLRVNTRREFNVIPARNLYLKRRKGRKESPESKSAICLL